MLRRVIILALLCATARADDSLDAWIATALEKNPGLLAARQKWEAAKQKVPAARSLEDPMIGVDVERMGTTRFDRYSDTEWMASQKLPWFGKRGARASVAALEAEAEGYRYLELMRKVRGNVTVAYWDLWLARRSAEIAGENRDLMKQFAAVARTRYETGEGMQADLLRAQVELAKMENEAITMQREASVAEAVVNRLLNAPPDTPRPLEKPAELPKLEATLEELQGRARKYCCILLSFLRAKEAKEAAVRVAKLEGTPDFEFRVEARQYNGRSGFQEYDTGVFLNFPWLWRGKYRAMVREAQADLKMAEADFEDEVNATLLDIKEMFTKTEASSRLIKLYDAEVLPQARQLVESTRVNYETGATTFLELVEAQRALRDAQLDYDRARAQFAKDHARLEQIAAPWGPNEFATGLVSPDMK